VESGPIPTVRQLRDDELRTTCRTFIEAMERDINEFLSPLVGRAAESFDHDRAHAESALGYLFG
jgi:hypothetical protein